MTALGKFKPVPLPQGDIGGLGPSKYKYETVWISGDFYQIFRMRSPPAQI